MCLEILDLRDLRRPDQRDLPPTNAHPFELSVSALSTYFYLETTHSPAAMQRTPAQPSHLRRRYQAFQEQRRRNGFRSSTTDTTLDGPSGLELSMHLPTDPSRNRFELLSTPSPPSNRARQDYRTSQRPRRHRYSRGTKEAKKRRDARRNRRKALAVQALDEQLSRDIDRTLTAANIYRTPQLRLPAPEPRLPAARAVTPPPAYMPPTPPPQLPQFDFTSFDLLHDFPQLANFSFKPTQPSPLFTPQIPKWCPYIPAIVDSKMSERDLPLFFDLSSLPESSRTPGSAPGCQALQLWQPRVSPRPVKHSRFFPPTPSTPGPTVRLPSIGCTLHKSDKGVQADLPTTDAPTAQTLSNRAEVSELAADDLTEPSASNLWRILMGDDKPGSDDNANAYVASFATKHPHDRLSYPLGRFDTRMEAIGMPAELDSAEVPYVHANSLTGEGNERAEYGPREIEEHRTVIYDSPRAMTPVEEIYVGLNEMVVDHDAGDEDEKRYWDAWQAFYELPPLPVAPAELDTQTLDAEDGCGAPDTTLLEINTPLTPPTEPAGHVSELSNAHFQSEQDLFVHPRPAPVTGHDFIDVASFLGMGHVPDCWCRPCQDMYEHDIEEDLPAPSATADEDWMVCTGAESPSTCSAWEWEWGTLVEDEGDGDGKADSLGWESDEAWRCSTPSVKAHGAW